MACKIERPDWLADDAVQIGPVSNPEFPDNREINREFCRFRPTSVIFAPRRRANSITCSQIPYATEQGIIFKEQGILAQEQGIWEFHLATTEIIAGSAHIATSLAPLAPLSDAKLRSSLGVTKPR
jgi:hypothetical protein